MEGTFEIRRGGLASDEFEEELSKVVIKQELKQKKQKKVKKVPEEIKEKPKKVKEVPEPEKVEEVPEEIKEEPKKVEEVPEPEEVEEVPEEIKEEPKKVEVVPIKIKGKALGSILRVKLMKGDLKRDTETFGKMDPIVIIEHRYEGYWESAECVNEGKKPNWAKKDKQYLDVKVQEKDQNIFITCRDVDVLREVMIGTGKFSCQEFMEEDAKMEKDVDIFYKNKKSGKINFHFEWL